MTAESVGGTSHARKAGLGRSARRRAGLLVLACLLLGILSGTTGLLLAGQHNARIGPVNVRFTLRPSLQGGSTVLVPPLGSIYFATHRGPLALRATVLELRPDVARSLALQPNGFAVLGDRVGADLQHALLVLVLKAVAAAATLTAVLGLLVFRSVRQAALSVTLCLGTLAVSALLARATFRPDSLREPQFSGLLASAPTAIGDAARLADNFSQYRLALGQLVGNVVQLYHVTSALPTYRPSGATVTVLHISDLHLNPEGVDLATALVQQFQVDAVLDTGDLTDHGTAAEGSFVSMLSRLHVPYVYVRGNHDSPETVAQVRRIPQSTVLDGNVVTVAGLRLAGIADPRFTPDKTNGDDDKAAGPEGEALAEVIRKASGPLDVALLHEPAGAGALRGVVPLVLAGHTHHREHNTKQGTLLLIEGSTGGAGLRGLEGAEPTPLECSVLYFDAATHQLQAWDEVTLGGLGLDSVTVSRHLRPKGAGVLPSPSPEASHGAAPSAWGAGVPD